jgi:hypothetical protein
MKKNITIILVIFFAVALFVTFCTGTEGTNGPDADINVDEVCNNMWDVCYSGLEGYDEESFKESCSSVKYSDEELECYLNAKNCEDIEECQN